jgi:predicted kinase
MQTSHGPTLYLVCGKIGAGKSTLSRALAARPRTLLIVQDYWMSVLYPAEIRTIDDFAHHVARLHKAIGPLIVDILRQDLSVVLDFPANTVAFRKWMRSLIKQADVAHELHFLDVPDDTCRARLRERNASGDHSYEVSEASFDEFTRYFVPPAADEGFNVIVHRA